MRRAFWSLTAILLCLWAHPAGANGGGYAFGVTFTGSVAPFQAYGTENVRILEEKLDVDLRRADASVAVRYTMKNLAEASVAVRFGFPVEAIRGDGYDDPEAVSPTESLRNAVQQLKGYTVTANGAPVKASLQLEPFASGKVKPFPGSAALKDVAGWMVSELTFPAGEPVTVEIRYTADHRGDDSWVSDDSHTSPRTFRYRLSTGAVWKGSIAKGTITVRADGIAADEVEIQKPRERFKRDGDRWVWTFEDLEPTLADDLVVQAVPGYSELVRYGARSEDVARHLERAGKWGAGRQEFKASASSTLRATKTHGFGAEILAGSDRDRAWSEGVPGDGVGEWVELRPAEARPLLAVAIWPGYQSDMKPALFEANGRPSRVEILLNDEHRFVATLGDAPGSQLVPVLGYAKPVSKVRITILAVFPGKKYADTCITRVVLYDRLEKRPDVHGSR